MHAGEEKGLQGEQRGDAKEALRRRSEEERRMQERSRGGAVRELREEGQLDVAAGGEAASAGLVDQPRASERIQVTDPVHQQVSAGVSSQRVVRRRRSGGSSSGGGREDERRRNGGG